MRMYAAPGCPGACAASRTNDARLRIERIGDPRDVEHLRGGPDAARSFGGNLAVASAAAAGLGNLPDHALAIEALCVERRHEIDADREHMPFIQRIARQQGMTAIQARALAILHHRDL